MRVLHSYCLNYNLGDHALGIGVKNLLRHFLPIELIGETNLQGREFNQYYIENVVNRLYELLVIGGGGIIHGAHWPQGWFWLIEKNRIRTIKIPFLVYGAGYNYFPGETGIPKRGIEHLRETVRSALCFLVRNDGSKERLLEETGIDAAEVPDPGFHVGLNTEFSRPVAEDYVVLQLANDKVDNRYHNTSKECFVKEIRRVARRINRHLRVFVMPHVYQDVELCRAVAHNLPGVQVVDFGRYAFDHAERIIGFYKYAHFVIAMRGHAQIIPISFNVPILSIETHLKNRGLMKKLGLLEFNVGVSTPNLSDTCIAIAENIQRLHSRMVERYRAINKRLWRETHDAWRRIVDRLS